MLPLIGFIVLVIDLYIWVVIAAAILSWLVAFNVVNTNNRIVLTIGDMLYRVTEPALRPIRNILPNLGGIDISPVILILLLLFIRDVVLLGWIAPAFVATS
jgi:YggT family protein